MKETGLDSLARLLLVFVWHVFRVQPFARHMPLTAVSNSVCRDRFAFGFVPFQPEIQVTLEPFDSLGQICTVNSQHHHKASMFITQVCFHRSRMLHKFVGRTVLVKDGNVDGALRVLNRIMGSEGLFDIYRRTRTYEKPFNTRRRVSWQMCKAIYDEDMERKIKFVARKNRLQPNPAFIL